MKTLEKRKNTKNGVARLTIVAIAFIVEFLMIYWIFIRLNEYAEWISVLTRLAGFIIVLSIYSSDKTSTIKMPWVMLVAAAPFAGVFLYLMIGMNPKLRSMKRRYNELHERYTDGLVTDDMLRERLKQRDAYAYNISEYIARYGRFPVFAARDLKYYSSAAEALEAQKEAFRNAEKFIFMEYYAIEDAQTWQEILPILEKKVGEGVEVRILYDDMGSIGFVDTDFAKKLRSRGIQCRTFNAFVPGLNLFLNNRDHRKITVVDGEIAFTGGYNLADEYFNRVQPYGFWKDSGIRLTGKAVTGFTAMYLEMWSLVERNHTSGDETSYLRQENAAEVSDGFIQPYGESPMTNERFAENIYIGMIEAARDYVWFTTPYLILTDEMISALSNAAKRGVDVRIITPGIPDKKIIYRVTRSFYHVLCKNGVKIYEYSPGFCHCKMCISDGERAICGTINLDYRSLYHHFENGCYFVHCDAIADMREDFEQMIRASRDVTEQYRTGMATLLGIQQLLLRFVAQLL